MPPLPVLAEVSVLALGLRLVVSLTIVLGIMGGLVYLARRRGRGFGMAFGTNRSAITVLGREALTRTSMIALVKVGDRALLVGASEHGIEVLEKGEELLPPEPEANEQSGPRDDRTSFLTRPDGRGSTRMTFMEALRERTVRRT